MGMPIESPKKLGQLTSFEKIGSIYSFAFWVKARIAAKNFAPSEFLNVQILRNRRIKNWHELCTMGISDYEISSRAVIGVSLHH